MTLSIYLLFSAEGEGVGGRGGRGGEMGKGLLTHI